MSLSPRDVVVEEFKDRFRSLFAQLCSCIEVEDRNRELIELARYGDELRRCLSEGVPCDFGIVKVIVKKGFLKKRVSVLFKGREVDRSTLLNMILRAREIVDWLSSDCTPDSMARLFVGVDESDRVASEIKSILHQLAIICRGLKPYVEPNLPDYARDGFRMAIDEFLRSRGGSA